MIQSHETKIEFPCDFPIKVIGKNAQGLPELVLSVIRGHISDFHSESIYSKESDKGKYISVTATVRVSNKNILDGIYQDLSKNPKIIMVL